MAEFALINKYFNKQNKFYNKNILLGIGDDTAILAPQNFNKLLITTDTLVSGVHFPENTHPEDIAHKALAVNLSDLAAMGAEPMGILLNLTMPSIDSNWLEKFSHRLSTLLEKYQIDLIGGDTTEGPLSITVTALGKQNKNPLLRSGAKLGDAIFVSGCLGDAAGGLDCILNHKTGFDDLINKLNQPEPQLDLGKNLVGVANSCIDISDGLLADLNHILNASNMGAKIDSRLIPISKTLKKLTRNYVDLALKGGDDYELCFTVPKSKLVKLKNINPKIKITQIGEIIKSGLYLDNNLIEGPLGYEHFDK